MKILVLTGDPKTLVYHRGEMLRTFSQEGMEVVAAAAGTEGSVTEFLEEIGGRYVPVKLDRTSLNPFQDVTAFLSILRLIRTEKPDMIFSYAIKSVIYGSLAARLAGVKWIFALVPGLGYAFTPDGTWKQRLVSLASTVLYSLAFRCTCQIFLQNHDDEDLLRARNILPERIPSHVTMGSGVRLDQFAFRDLSADRALQEGRVRFVLVSRLLKKKGVEEFARAAEAIREEYPEAEFELIGPTDSSPDAIVESDVNAWEESGFLHWMGAVQDVAARLGEAHVFVLPTWYREGVPRSILEALSCGLTIITTDAVGARETVDLTPEGEAARDQEDAIQIGRNGLLIRPKDQEALRAAMRLLLEDPKRIAGMGLVSRELAESRFDVRRVNAGILQVIQNHLDGAGNKGAERGVSDSHVAGNYGKPC